ncbi:MAG: hypothetical protein R6T90_08735 [Dissulfuribacterales bacterium]
MKTYSSAVEIKRSKKAFWVAVRVANGLILASVYPMMCIHAGPAFSDDVVGIQPRNAAFSI